MDQTIVKPTPGKKKGNAPQPATVVESDNTVLLTQMIKEEKESSVIAYGSNTLLAEANVIFSLLGQIRSTAAHSDVKQLREAFVQKMRDYENRLRLQNANAKQIDIARYCLCCAIDEAVLNTTWGSQSVWGHNSLLSTFYSNTQGGEQFFVHLDECLKDAKQSLDLLEVMYLCMSLGFKGHFRLKENGNEQHRALKIQVMDVLKNNERVPKNALGEGCIQNVLMGEQTTEKAPIWVVLSITAALLACVYMYLSFSLNEKSDATFTNLINLLPDRQVDATHESYASSLAISREMERFLATEIEMGILQVEALADRVRITFQSQDLFQSGSAEMVAHIQPVVSKVARALEATNGKILVVGHTDNEPIFTSKFPSNWHLSLARATSLTDRLMASGALHGRIIPEGRGDAKPLASNDTLEGRQKNRRVEIDLLIPNQLTDGNN
ncbi:flagellar motor protein [Vibrio navarrensis]|uniref:Flagellar motor protein n=1 Tax=Vibrio navarrensis TaxID=29495 RepID=A0A099LWK5_9VIBR|nr:type VI secretion system protein TssL, long form [Vibrio navarrensis]KGK12054.1 flagellar motor protein [Vibrio navarrensis]KGK19227.1 flagellar motor protein [Vibrio navarrensis]MBE3666899.1 flagellar motor protein [Vibrio navarrensis]MBE4573034.1 flagellar motor protein [Vibrio navarrensis]MBE4578610.1 flagellar motor protein [Vibrio navarrensis]